jgi:hypothetical protein
MRRWTTIDERRCLSTAFRMPVVSRRLRTKPIILRVGVELHLSNKIFCIYLDCELFHNLDLSINFLHDYRSRPTNGLPFLSVSWSHSSNSPWTTLRQQIPIIAWENQRSRRQHHPDDSHFLAVRERDSKEEEKHYQTMQDAAAQADLLPARSILIY